jgi:hypothetical protein
VVLEVLHQVAAELQAAAPVEVVVIKMPPGTDNVDIYLYNLFVGSYT